jgi:C-terminal processing protease CtpA/Prc
VPAGDLVPDLDPPGWPPVDPAEVARRAASVKAVTRRPDGVGILTLDGLDDLPLASPFLEAAFALLEQSAAVVLDLRDNGGGDPGTVALVLSWLLGPERRHFADVVRRDRVEQWWTTPRPSSRSVPPETRVAVLVGSRTYSSGEALAYVIQSSGRAVVVGRPSRGAADHITPIVLHPYVRGVLPEAYYWDPMRNGNWEGVGVLPDVRVAEDAALEVAVRALHLR